MADYTNFYVDYALDNNDAQSDATMSATGEKDISQISELPTGTNSSKAITQEHNFVILDGTYTDDIGAIAFISDEKSDSDGLFVTNPMITATFTQQHTSFILTFNFIEDSPIKAEIKWYLGENLMYGMEQEWEPNQTIQTVQQAIEAYDKVTIEFLQALPDRYIKLNRVEFGTTMHWDETIVKSATLVKGCNRLSDSLSVDTLTFELVDTSNSMNFGNPKGMHVLFKKNQAMYPVEVLQNSNAPKTELPLGKFYLDTFTTEGNIGKIIAHSYLGVLDKIQYPGSYLFNNQTADYIINDILSWAGLDSSEYDIAYDVAHTTLPGLIKPTTCREAIREVLFACHANIDTTNPDKIKIYRYPNVISTGLDRHTKIYTKVSTSEVITGVKLNYSTYETSETAETISRGTYNKGIYTVDFTEGYSSLGLSNARLIHGGAYSITFEVLADDTTVTITGHKLVETQKNIIIKRELKEGEVENIKEFSSSLCDDVRAIELAQTILGYYNDNNLIIQVQHYAQDISMDYLRAVENPNQELDGFIAMFSQRTFDLTGGFVDTAQMLGKYDASNRYYFTKTYNEDKIELYTGEETEII